MLLGEMHTDMITLAISATELFLYDGNIIKYKKFLILKYLLGSFHHNHLKPWTMSG